MQLLDKDIEGENIRLSITIRRLMRELISQCYLVPAQKE